jgi:pyruvate dehydrogenase E2 component (dihydrolipoamide acetyltransferase)
MDIRLPPLAEGVDSATVVSILVKEGDVVQPNQTILELETAKAVGSVPSPSAGKITKILVKEGQEVKIGQVVATMEAEGNAAASAPQPSAPRQEAPRAAASAQPAAQASAARAPQSPPQSSPPNGIPVAASPSLRKMARDLGLDLSHVRGTGPGGRIELLDVRSYLQYLQQTSGNAPAAAAPAAPSASTAKPLPPLPDFSKWGPVRKEAVSTIRRTIAEHMVSSWQNLPHVTQFYEADVTDLLELRKKHAPAYEKKSAKLTLTGFIVYSLARLLKKHALFNSSYDPENRQIIYKEYVHIGIAVDTDAGLVVPVIRDADKKSLLDISLDIQKIAEKARDRKLAMEEMQGGTFTLSNEGAIGGAYFTPIINAPEVAILGVGQGLLKPVVRNKAVEPRLMLPLSLSHDHRVVDGGAAARFLRELTELLEKFKTDDAQLAGVKG